METIFFNIDRAGTQTFQVRKDEERQLILIRPFSREGTKVVGICDEYVFDSGALRADPDHGRFWGDHMCWVVENRNNPMIPSFCRALYPFCPPGAPDPDMRPLAPRWISIFVPFEDSKVSEMMVMCYVGAGLPMIETSAQQLDRRVIERDLMPGFRVEVSETCPANGTIRGRIFLNSKRTVARTTAFLSADAGYLPRREVELRDGQGEFTFSARDLLPGETARVDFGFRYYGPKTSVRIGIS